MHAGVNANGAMSASALQSNLRQQMSSALEAQEALSARMQNLAVESVLEESSMDGRKPGDLKLMTDPITLSSKAPSPRLLESVCDAFVGTDTGVLTRCSCRTSAVLSAPCRARPAVSTWPASALTLSH